MGIAQQFRFGLRVGDCVVGVDVVRGTAGRHIFIIVPSSDGGRGSRVAELKPECVVHYPVGLADSEGHDVV